jgi:hypothetical protein
MSSIPTTGRKPDYLAKQFGYLSVDDMAKKLKRSCTVFDIGSGTSTLGNEVTVKRGDIKWINIDPCYADAEYANFFDNTDGNVELLGLDICSKNDLSKLKGRKADYILSYWLLPHLSTHSNKPALLMADSMHALLENDGVMIIGPIRKLGLGLLSPWRYKSSIRFNQSDEVGDVKKGILHATKLWWLPRIVQGLSNKYNIHIAKKFVGAVK